MNSIYVIISSNKVTIERHIEKILSPFKEIERIRYDLTETPIEKVIEDLDTYNFLSNQKGVIASSASFLSKETTKSEVTHNIQAFEKYILNPSPENILILIADSIDKRKKIVTTLMEHATVLDQEMDIHSLIKEELEDYQVDTKTINFLISYCGNQQERILKEIEKLKIYKMESKEITISDIQEVVMRSMEDNIYSLVDSILNGKKKDSFLMYQDLLLQGEQASSILSKLANKIRLIYQVKILVQDGYSDQQIGKQLNIHPYPVKLAREVSYKYSENMLAEYLSKLSQVDLKMKQGSTVAGLAFEVFMASI